MRKKFNLKVTLASLSLLAVFLFIRPFLCFSGEIELKLSKTENSEGNTLLELMSSGPVECHWFYIDNPPVLAVDFLGEDVLSGFDKKVIFEEGPVKEIKTYYVDENKKTVDFLLFELRRAADIKTLSGQNTLVFEAQDAFLALSSDLTQRQQEIAEALFTIKQEKQAEKKPSVLNAEQNVVIEAIDEKIVFAGRPDASLEQFRKADKEAVLEKEVIAADGQKKLLLAVAAAANISNENIVQMGKPFLFKKAAVPEISAGAGIFKSAGNERYDAYLGRVKGILALQGCRTVFVYMIASMSALGMMGVWYRRKSEQAKERLSAENTVKRFVPQKAGRAADPKPESDEKKYEERRKFPRLEMADVSFRQQPRFKIEPAADMRQKQTCFLKNLSLSGACFEVDTNERISAIIQVDIILPQEHLLEICARIVWKKEIKLNRNMYGIDFLTIDRDSRNNLKQYLTRNLKDA